jgi:hypothetical protein
MRTRQCSGFSRRWTEDFDRMNMIHRMNLPEYFRILTILAILSQENGPIFHQRPSPGLRPPSPPPASDGHQSRNGFRVFCVFRGSTLRLRVSAVEKHRTSNVVAGRMPALPMSPGEAGVRLLSFLRPCSGQLFDWNLSENQLTDSRGRSKPEIVRRQAGLADIAITICDR